MNKYKSQEAQALSKSGGMCNHLGSTAFVTDNNATVTQGFLYAPFGEIVSEYSAGFANGIMPKYAFNAKELDEETGMYYYEARYYNPPVFVSRDPMFEKYFWMTPYAYCANNPVKYVDPSGETIEIALEEKKHKDDDVGKTVIYKDGKLYNKNSDGTIGEEYTENSLYARTVQKHLNQLKEDDPSLSKIINTLETDTKHTHTISMIARSYDDKGRLIEAGNGFDALSNENASIKGIGSGSEINYNPWNKYVRDPITKQTTTRPPKVGLAHELGHAWHAHKGTADFNVVNGLSNFERQAMKIENIAREALGIPLRRKY